MIAKATPLDRLIEGLKKTCWGKSAHVVDDERRKAASALSALKAENANLRAERETVEQFISTAYAAILLERNPDAVKAIEKWKGQKGG